MFTLKHLKTPQHKYIIILIHLDFNLMSFIQLSILVGK